MKNIQLPIKNKNKLTPGTIIRRTNKEKDQQGCFVRLEEDNLILINIIDIKNKTLFASEGILKPQRGDKLYYYNSSFKDNPLSKDALEIIKRWPLYKKNTELQTSIVQFVCATYVPEQILEWQESDSLPLLFVPIKQKFRLGNQREKRDPSRVYKDKFKMWLDSLFDGEHITYVAHITQRTSYPKFYTIGTKPHQETEKSLLGTAYSFKPTDAGHIKANRSKNNKKHFLLDAGSNYIGRGVKTPLHVAEKVAEALRKFYPEYEFTPLVGRGAFGSGQSF